MKTTELQYMQEMLPAIKSMVDNANQLITWTLSVVGGSIIVLVSSSYIKPLARWWRMIYLLFIIGWVLMGISLYHGNIVNQYYNGAQFSVVQAHANIVDSKFDEAEKKKVIFMNAWAGANNSYAVQINSFLFGLLFFAIWLAAFLVWWIFIQNDSNIETISKNK